MARKPRLPRMGPKTRLSREEAIEQYILLRLRANEIKRLAFLVEELYGSNGRVEIAQDAPFSRADLRDTVRTAFFGWFATLTDTDPLAVYAFDPLWVLFPEHGNQILKVQVDCEACHEVLQQFRNTVAFHNRAELSAHFKARQALMEEGNWMNLEFARKDFLRLMEDLITQELQFIPELPKVVMGLGLLHHPAFANPFPAESQPREQVATESESSGHS